MAPHPIKDLPWLLLFFGLVLWADTIRAWWKQRREMKALEEDTAERLPEGWDREQGERLGRALSKQRHGGKDDAR